MIDIEANVILFWIGVALIILALGIGIAPILLTSHALYNAVFIGLIVIGSSMIIYAFIIELRNQPYHKVKKLAKDVDKYIENMRWK